MKILLKLLLAFSLLFVLFSRCEKEEFNPSNLSSEDSIYYYVNGLMNYWYLWNDSVPEVNYMSYDTPQDLVNDLKIDIDHWSFVDKAATVNSVFNEGEDFGFGFLLGWDDEKSLPTTQLRVVLVYNNTDAYIAGIRRGCIITKIDNIPVRDITDFTPFYNTSQNSMKFDFIDNNGVEHTTTTTKKTYNMNSVLFSNTYTVNGKITGYMVFNSFLGFSKEELEETIDFFKSAGITELILDLRYNGGGYVSIAEELANIIAPSSIIGETFYSMKHNRNRSAEYDTTIAIKTDTRNLGLERIFIITNQYSASASELLINGLDPLIDVIQIGYTTYGKPVAMYGFKFQDWIAYPVTARSVNSIGYGDYFGGLVPDKMVIDKHKYDWGNETEPALSQAFHYITFGNFDDATATVYKTAPYEGMLEGKTRIAQNLLLMDR